jgi:phage shock protein A
MPRTRPPVDLSLAQLERLMQSRRTEVTRLSRERDKLQKKLDALNERISEISGGTIPGASAGARARNATPLQDVIHQVLTKSGSAMSVGDIMEKVRAGGYRSNSSNFRGIVNQTLIKDKRFASTGRGMYQLKK